MITSNGTLFDEGTGDGTFNLIDEIAFNNLGDVHGEGSCGGVRSDSGCRQESFS